MRGNKGGKPRRVAGFAWYQSPFNAASRQASAIGSSTELFLLDSRSADAIQVWFSIPERERENRSITPSGVRMKLLPSISSKTQMIWLRVSSGRTRQDDQQLMLFSPSSIHQCSKLIGFKEPGFSALAHRYGLCAWKIFRLISRNCCDGSGYTSPRNCLPRNWVRKFTRTSIHKFRSSAISRSAT